MGTQIKESADKESVNDSLRKALEDAHWGDDGPENVVDDAEGAGEDVDEEIEEAEAVDETEEVEAEAEAPAEEASAEDGEEDDSEADAEEVKPPEHWSKEDKAAFMAAPPEVRGWLLQRHKAMEGDYTRKTQDIARLKQYGEVDQILAPYRSTLQRAGINEAAYLTQLVNTDLALSRDPARVLSALAQKHGLAVVRRDGGEQVHRGTDHQQYQMPPEVAARIQRLEQAEQTRTHQAAEGAQRSIQQRIDEFAEAKDADGNLAHPYFDEVLDDMVGLVHAAHQRGQQPDLQKIYNDAVLLNPSVRERQAAAQKAAQHRNSTEEARAKAAKAKKAAARKRTPSKSVQSDPKDLRGLIASQF